MRMYCLGIVFYLLSAFVYGAVYAGPVTEFELQDGTLIQGEVSSYSEGIYEVKSSSGAVVSIRDADIHAIRYRQAPVSSTEGAAPGALDELISSALQDFNAHEQSPQGAVSLPGGTAVTVSDSENIRQKAEEFKESIISDPEAMSIVTDLQNDPEMQRLLSDPAVLEAIKSGDINMLINNPAFLQFLDNPNFKKIQRRIESSD